jgi:hypothetical protein
VGFKYHGYFNHVPSTVDFSFVFGSV